MMNFPDEKPFQDRQGIVIVAIRFVSETLGAKMSYRMKALIKPVKILHKYGTGSKVQMVGFN